MGSHLAGTSRIGTAVRAALAAALAVACALVLAAPAAAELSTAVSVPKAKARNCFAAPASGGEGYVQRRISAPALGSVRSRLTSAGGDWDLAIFDARTGRAVAGSSGFGADEVATGWVVGGQELIVQACRLSGTTTTAALFATVEPIDVPDKLEKISMVRIATPTPDRKRDLLKLGLDLTEHGGPGFVGALLHGEADAKKLREAKFTYRTDQADVVAAGLANRKRDAAYDARIRASALPSGRTRYRRLADYEADMKKLVDENPGFVKPLALPFKTFEGRTVSGIEITPNVEARDGKPVFLQMGVHHAREWPSSENVMEWAIDLVNGYKAGDSRIRRLLAASRVIFVPVVNPDGFNASREAGELRQAGEGRGGPDETANIVAHTNEYRRKNCRFIDDSEGGSCVQPGQGVAEAGVDPNRNYGQFWGGPGASSDPTSLIYYGPGPFSEPETKNVRDLISKRQVTALITNHTFSNLILRPPGIAALGEPIDEAVLKELGDRMAGENGYFSQHGYDLYDTSGTTEDWSYNATGGLGYTFEIGCVEPDPETQDCVTGHFHPPFADMVAEYEGTSPHSDPKDANGNVIRNGGGNREAYFHALEATADPAKHSVIGGKAGPGTVLRLKKTFKTETSQVGADDKPTTFDDTLETTFAVPPSGQFEWHVNPSTRPVVALDRGRNPKGPPSPPLEFTGSPASAQPCGELANRPQFTPESCYDDHVFEIKTGDNIDNAFARLELNWATQASDWDMRVYKADAEGKPTGAAVITAATGPSDTEQGTLGPDTPGKYVARVFNFAAAEPYTLKVTFLGPPPFVAGQKENWTLTCETPDGKVLATEQVYIVRGQRVSADLCATASQITNEGRPVSETVRKKLGLELTAPRLASDVSRKPSFPVRLGLSGIDIGLIDSYQLEVRAAGERSYRRIASGVKGKGSGFVAKPRFAGTPGEVYTFRARALTKAGALGGWVYRTTIVPFDERKSKSSTLSTKFRGGWHRFGERGAYFRGFSRSTRKGARMTFRFTGRTLYLVGRQSALGGRARVVIDGRIRRTVDFYGSRARNRRLIRSISAGKGGRHSVRIVTLGTRSGASRGTRVEIDAIGVR